MRKSAHRTRQAVLPEDIADERRAQRDETLDAVLALSLIHISRYRNGAERAIGVSRPGSRDRCRRASASMENRTNVSRETLSLIHI